MFWIMLIASLGFAYISASMFVSGRRETNPEEKSRLLRSALGTLALAVMGAAYAIASWK